MLAVHIDWLLFISDNEARNIAILLITQMLSDGHVSSSNSVRTVCCIIRQ